MARRIGRGDFHQLDAGAGQLGLGLHPVAAVDPQAGELGGDHQGAHRAGETAEPLAALPAGGQRSEEHTSELQSLMRNSYDVFCLKKKTNKETTDVHTRHYSTT